MYCNGCGKKLPEGSVFCDVCGADLRQANMTYVQSPDNMQQTNINQGFAPVCDDNNKVKNKGGKKLLIIPVVVISAVAAVVAGIFLDKKKSNPDRVGEGVYINDKFYAYSAEEGIEGLKNIEFACQVDNLKYVGIKCERIDDPVYMAIEGNEITDKEVQNPSALLDFRYVLSDDNREVDNPGNHFMGIYSALSSKGSCSIDGKAYKPAIAYRTISDEDVDYCYCPAISFALIDDYKLDGITKDSSIEEIEKAGYRPAGYENTFVTFYSEKSTNWDDIDADYEKIYNSDLTHAEILRDYFDGYIDYGEQYIGAMGNLSTVLDASDYSRFDLSISPKTEEQYNNNFNNSKNAPKYTEYEDVIKFRFAFSQQLYYLEKGEIDYFVIAEIESAPAKKDRYFSYYRGDEDSFTYDDNVARIYVVSDVDTATKWLEEAGWR